MTVLHPIKKATLLLLLTEEDLAADALFLIYLRSQVATGRGPPGATDSPRVPVSRGAGCHG